MALLLAESFGVIASSLASNGSYVENTKWNQDGVLGAGVVGRTASAYTKSAWGLYGSIQASDGRRSGAAFYSGVHGNSGIRFRPRGDMSETTLIQGVAFKLTGSLNYGDATKYIQIFDFTESPAISHVSIRVHYDGTITAYRGGADLTSFTLLGTSAALTWLPNTWYYIEAKVFIHGSTGTVEVRRDGATVLNLTSQDTINNNLGTGFIQAPVLYGLINAASSVWIIEGGVYFSDWYVCDTNGSNNIDFLGDVRVDCLRVNGAGTYTDFTPLSGANYTNVDETSTDGDTSYVYSDTVGDKDSYTFTNLSHTPVSIYGLQTTYVARRTDGVLRETKAFTRLSATDYDITTSEALPDGYWAWNIVTELSPDTGVAWTKSEIDAAEFGVEVLT